MQCSTGNRTNSGQRGRVNNADPRKSMNPKQLLAAYNKPREEVKKEQYSRGLLKEHDASGTLHQTKAQKTESERLKRKAKSFTEIFENEKKKKQRKLEIKAYAKNEAKLEHIKKKEETERKAEEMVREARSK